MSLSLKSISAYVSHILRLPALAAAVGMLCAVSCSETREAPGEEPALPGDSNTVTTEFTITVSSGAVSRAPGTLGPDYDAGEGFENFIDLNGGDFRFYFFGPDNKYVETFTISVLTPLNGNASSKRYVASGKVRREIIDNKDLKMVVLANWKSYPADTELVPGVTTIDQLCGQIYEFDPAMMELSETNTIPLYGVTNILDPKQINETTFDIGTIHLLRAYAKIEVHRAEAGFEIENVHLRRYNKRGYCAPGKIYLQDDYVHGNYEQDYANTPHIPDGAYTDVRIPFRKIDDDTYVAYVPEFDNRSDAARRSSIEILFNATSDVDVVEFKYYDGPRKGQHFNLLRNYWYRFNVLKKGVIVQVVPYSEVLLNPIFGLGNRIELVEVEIDGLKYYYDRETGRFYDESLFPIDNPYFNDTDPSTGWSIRRDDNNLIICYYDNETGVSYAINKITRILDPLNTVAPDAPTKMIVADADNGHLYYYHSKSQSIFFGTNGYTQIRNPFDYYDKTDDIIRYVSFDRKSTFGYYNITERCWLAPDRSTQIRDPFTGLNIETGRARYTSADGSVTYGYYSTQDLKWYDAPQGGNEIKNPF